ncbi:MAG: S-layer homology domain-containing protein [Bacillota bacterium]
MRAAVKHAITFYFVLLAMFYFSGPSFGQYGDIQGHWAQQKIEDWSDSGLCEGYPDGTFRPDAGISRAEFITLTNKAFGLEGKIPSFFLDVSPDDWFVEEVEKAKSTGYILGYEDGTFRPGHEIKRQEMAAIIAKLLRLNTYEDLGRLVNFRDRHIMPRWAKKIIIAVAAHGYMYGYPDNTFRPYDSVTRAEAISALDRARRDIKIAPLLQKIPIEYDEDDENGENNYSGGWFSNGNDEDSDTVHHPLLHSAFLIIDDRLLNVPLNSGLDVELNLGLSGLNLSPESRLIAGVLIVTEDSFLKTTLPLQVFDEDSISLNLYGNDITGLKLLDINPVVFQKLRKGINKILLISGLGLIDLSGQGISFDKLKSLFGETATFTGTLTDCYGETYSFGLTVIFP